MIYRIFISVREIVRNTYQELVISTCRYDEGICIDRQ